MHEFRCIGPRDLCASTQDCPDRQDCTWNPDTERRECISAGVCGRPFLVAEQPRLPPIAARAIGATLRARASITSSSVNRRSWPSTGPSSAKMEHASIAAFARFSLQLLSLGAPPDLVEACTRALADETEHAKLC